MLSDSLDIQAIVASYIINTQVLSNAVYNNELPLSDGVLTCQYPNVAINLIDQREEYLNCNNVQLISTVQLVFRNTKGNGKRVRLVSIINEIKDFLRQLMSYNNITFITFNNLRLIPEERELNLIRYDLDVVITHQERI